MLATGAGDAALMSAAATVGMGYGVDRCADSCWLELSTRQDGRYCAMGHGNFRHSLADADRIWWAVIALLAAGAVGAYVWVEDSRVGMLRTTSASHVDRERAAPVVPVPRQGHVQERTRPANATAEASERALVAQRAAVVKALGEAVRQARERRLDNNDAVLQASVETADRMPLVEMSWDQYRSWTKYADALARRDYKGVMEMLPDVRKLFGPGVARAMEDAYVQDYEAYLAEVVDTRCDQFDPESVWRKTIFMPFVLESLNRSSEAWQHKASAARQACGFEA